MFKKRRDTKTDEDFMLAFKAGDAAAFGELYTRYDRQVLGYLARQMRSSSIEAQDIAQEVWLALSKASTSYTYTGAASFRTYLFTIVHNKCISFYRKESQGRFTPPIDDNENPYIKEEIDQFSTPEQQLLQEEQRNLLDKALQVLAAHHREILLYRYMEEFSVPEIAEIMAIPLEQAKSRLRYAKKALQTVLEQYEQES